MHDGNDNVKDAVKNHVKRVMKGQPGEIDVNKNLINVRRNHVFKDYNIILPFYYVIVLLNIFNS